MVKYDTRKGQNMVLDVPPMAHPHLGDPAVTLWITEGPMKADSAISNGIDCCIALPGVWNFKGKNTKGGSTVLADWDAIHLKDGRQVVIAFDSDALTKTSVYDAAKRLAGMLKKRGADVQFCLLPDDPEGEKVGLDDFFAAGGAVEQLYGLISDNPGDRPTPPPERRTRRARWPPPHRDGQRRTGPRGLR